MDWTTGIQDVLQRYAGQGTGAATAPADPHQDYQQVVAAAPRQAVASGITQAFRSDQTPPFPQMLANLFNHSDPNQRAGVLNHLLSSIGPGALSSLPAAGGLASLLRGGNVTPDQARQVSPADVQQIAAHAQQQNPSIVDRIGEFYSQHPDVMKAAGGLALSIALQHMFQHR